VLYLFTLDGYLFTVNVTLRFIVGAVTKKGVSRFPVVCEGKNGVSDLFGVSRVRVNYYTT